MQSHAVTSTGMDSSIHWRASGGDCDLDERGGASGVPPCSGKEDEVTVAVRATETRGGGERGWGGVEGERPASLAAEGSGAGTHLRGCGGGIPPL